MDANFLLIILAVPAYIAASHLLLGLFKVYLAFFTNFASKRASNPLWKSIRPYLQVAVRSLEGTFGPAHKFVPNPTQVLLVALMLVVLVSVERILISCRPQSSRR